MSGKMDEMKAKVGVQLSSAKGQSLAEAARQELAPIIGRLEEILTSLDAIPRQIEETTAARALGLRESLSPLAEQIRGLRTTLETMPKVADLQAISETMKNQSSAISSLKTQTPLTPSFPMRQILVLAMGTSVLTAFLVILGVVSWLGIADSSRLQQHVSEHRTAWEKLYQAQTPQGKQAMDAALEAARSAMR